jgi:gliding motility-associated-like protein
MRNALQIPLLMLVILLSFDGMAQGCGLVVNDPPCQNGPVNITTAAITAGSTNIGTLSYWLNSSTTAPLPNPTAITQSGIYYIKNVTPSCTEVKMVRVTIGTTPPTSTSFLYTLCGSSTSTSVFFDFQDIGQTSFTLTYSIDGAPPVVVNQVSPTSYYVTGVSQNQVIEFTVAWNGVCHPPKKVIGHVPGSSPNFTYNNTSLCVGEVLSTTSPNGISGTWSPATVQAGTRNYTFTATCHTPQTVSITGIAPVNPAFTIPSICQGVTPPANFLPTTSDNGITGTWNPPTVNTSVAGTFQHTFTPNPTLFPCAMTRVVNVQVTSPNANPTFAFGNNVTLCSGATTGVPQLVNTSQNGITGTWSPATVNTTASGTYTFTPNPSQCSQPFTLNVQITPSQAIQFAGLTSSMSLCQGGIPPALPTTSDNAAPVTGTWNPSTISTATPGTRTYTFTAAAGQCVTAPTYQISVLTTPSGTPTFDPIPDLCHQTTSIPPLPTTSLEGIQGTWSPATLDVSTVGTRTYNFAPTAGNCAAPTSMTVTVIPRTNPQFAPVPSFCAGSTPPVLPTTSLNGIEGVWSPATVSDMQSGTYQFIPLADECANPYQMQIVVDQPQSPGFANIAFCQDQSVPNLPTVSPLGYSGTWNPAAIDPTLSSSTYEFTPDAGQCATSQVVNVTVHPIVTPSPTWITSGYFESGTVTILVSEPGSFVYQLDNGPIQESNVFTNVPGGIHSFTVYDVNGCIDPVVFTDVIHLVNYPHFFTPNGDGINDTWNIFDLTISQDQAKIFIFDRYGKLLKQIAPAGIGWDGTYNGNPVPASDYWFVVEYMENGRQREFKSHFSLKR